MPCNLAVTITKAAVANEQLTKLLTPEVVKQLLEAFISNHPEHQAQKPHAFIRTQDGEVTLPISRYGFHVHVRNGKVTISSVPTYYRQEADALAEQLATLLAKAADKLFAGQVQKALAKFGNVEAQTTTVQNTGEKQQVRVFTLEI